MIYRSFMTCEKITKDWGIAPKPKQSAPFLDIEELLEQERWKDRDGLRIEDEHSLRDSINFMKLALVGNEIAHMTTTQQIISADLISINAFNITNKAYQYMNIDDLSFEDLVKTSVRVLQSIISKRENNESVKALDEKDLSITHDFFKNIAKIVFATFYYK